MKRRQFIVLLAATSLPARGGTPRKKVLVLGAGLAGLAAADELVSFYTRRGEVFAIGVSLLALLALGAAARRPLA